MASGRGVAPEPRYCEFGRCRPCVLALLAMVLQAVVGATPPTQCAGTWDNCQSTRCCQNASHECFEKDSTWASCKSTCAVGIDGTEPLKYQTPWTCKILTPGQGQACSVSGVGCMTTRCCADPTKHCFEKDQYWADCKSKCKSGISSTDPAAFRTPWSCKRLDVQGDVNSTDVPENPKPSEPAAPAAEEAASKCSSAWANCQSTRCCSEKGHSCFEKDETWADCRPTCQPGINPDDPLKYRTPWQCRVLRPVVFRGSALPGKKVLAPPGSPVALHGRLQVKGSQVLGSHGRPVRVRGVSLFWSQWGSRFWNSRVVSWLRDDWRISLIRAAMGVEDGGYLDAPDRHKQIVADVVDAAILAGLYVIIDWHDHLAHLHQKAAISFFREMAQMYGHYPNVIFETWNEPTDQSWSQVVKPYHVALLGAIRPHTRNLVTCGSPKWCQDVDVASADPIEDQNVAYSLHFYAATHQAGLRRKADKALKNGAALFVTEWGLCQAHGDGALNYTDTHRWLRFLEKHNISDASWAVNDKDESCDALVPGANSTGGWGEQDLTSSGRFVRRSLVDMPESPKYPSKSEEDTDAFDEDGCRALTCLGLLLALIFHASCTFGQCL